MGQVSTTTLQRLAGAAALAIDGNVYDVSYTWVDGPDIDAAPPVWTARRKHPNLSMPSSSGLCAPEVGVAMTMISYSDNPRGRTDARAVGGTGTP